MTALALVFLFLLGVVIGSFLNVVLARVPAGQSLSGRSKCRRCGHQIRPHDNIPIVSWLILRGRCRDCNEPISWRYPAVELAIGAVFVATGYAVISIVA